MFDTYELQDPWLKGEFEKAFAAGFAVGVARAEARGEAMGARRLLRDLLLLCGITPNDDALESADAPQLRAWIIDMFRGTRPEVLCQR